MVSQPASVITTEQLKYKFIRESADSLYKDGADMAINLNTLTYATAQNSAVQAPIYVLY